MTFRILVLFFIFIANVSSAATFSTNNKDADFDECMKAWKKGNVIYQFTQYLRVFVHYKNRIFDISFSKEKGGYICNEKFFSEGIAEKKKVKEQEPEDFNVLKFICRSDGLKLYIPYCEKVKSSENLLSIKAKFPNGKKVKLKNLSYTGTKDNFFIEIQFFPHKIPPMERIFLKKEISIDTGFICKTRDSNTKEIEKASKLKFGNSYTVVGTVDDVGKYALSLTNCSFERD